jgi:peptidoglycan/LPS O-acetylase OafA/YrhL
MIHDSHVLETLGLSRFDPWFSYVLLIVLSLVALYFIEKPAQRKLREWMHATNVVKETAAADS